MTRLRVRRPSFRIDASVPFQWQPANPNFGLFANAFTFLVVAFERYIVSVMRESMARITDPAVAEEADAFLRQEAQHARAHWAHAKAMISHFPGLADTLTTAHAAYDELFAREDVEFHLAYIANLEATFTPLFRMVFDNRGPLFEGGDERVGTLFLWHFVEEIEHRSSALLVHHHVTPDRWYRIRKAPRVFKHVAGIYQDVLSGLEQHVPLEVRQVPTAAVGPSSLWLSEMIDRLPLLRRRRKTGVPMLGHVSGRELRTMIWRLAKSQMPNRDPANEPLPEWVDEWHAAFDAAADVTTYAGARL